MTSIYNDAPPTSSEEWFDNGRRVYFDPTQKKFVQTKNSDSVLVFEKTVNEDSDKRWITMMPGFPDGSFGYTKIESLLKNETAPRLYIEYVGQGDSEKPAKYKYSTMERADLVEAQWQAHGITKTVLVTFDYSSIVMLELLQRQRERIEKGNKPFTTIEHVLSVNGGLFADGHTHPFTTTPLLKTPFGRMGAWMAQCSNFVFDTMLEPLYSKEYNVSKKELRETERAIRLHRGALFLANAAGFVDEHKRQSERWNLQTIYEKFALQQGITFHLVGSHGDQFEHMQIDLAKERLGHYEGVQVERIPGGHLSTSEQSQTFANMIQVLARKEPPRQSPSWSNVKRQ